MPGYKMRMWDGQSQYFGSNPSSPEKLPGRSKYDGITLERGVTEDTGFADWAAGVVANGGTPSSGGNTSAPQKIPGQSKFDSITLERGVTKDTGFANWAASVSGQIPGQEASPQNFRKDIYLEFFNESGQPVISYKISGGWVTEYPPGILHSLLRRDGKTVREKLAGIFAESLRRLG